MVEYTHTMPGVISAPGRDSKTWMIDTFQAVRSDTVN